MPGTPRATPAGPSLFDPPDVRELSADASAPLAVRMRPRDLSELVGQSELVAPGSPLRRLIEGSGASSVILWGPPGTGKTTIAALVSRAGGRRFVELSAVTAGVKEVRAAIDSARMSGVPTVLFIDEVHRFTRTQQDALLPGVENGWVTLVAATTENPSFSVVAPLLSRSLLLALRSLAEDEVGLLLDRAVSDPRGLAGRVRLAPDARADLVRYAGGDARRALTYLEAAADAVDRRGPAAEAVEDPGPAADPLHRGASADLSGGADAPPRSRSGGGRGADAVNRPGPAADPVEGPGPGADAVDRPDGHGPDGDGSGSAHPAGVPVVTAEHVAAAVQRALVRYDRTGDQHYDVISAFIKSVRGSDVDAALHYLARMIEAGEDPRFIARRLVILASEDVGMADPTALGVATAAMTAAAQIGLPEARLPLAQATIHLSCAPKSNAVIRAIDAAQADVRAGRIGPVPPHLRDGHHPGAAAQGVVGYRYPHEDPSGVLAQQYAPDPVRGRRYYAPTGHGVEARLGDLVERLRAAVDGTRVDPARGSRDEPTP